MLYYWLLGNHERRVGYTDLYRHTTIILLAIEQGIRISICCFISKDVKGICKMLQLIVLKLPQTYGDQTYRALFEPPARNSVCAILLGSSNEPTQLTMRPNAVPPSDLSIPARKLSQSTPNSTGTASSPAKVLTSFLHSSVNAAEALASELGDLGMMS